ncbi:MAG TPA: class I SAM-dependent methyltransferase [Blastocatellia bacterium]|jgi:predicted O-methyltransferase YrrM|nr:class I SAM-dependent methyltransferase [Blastocatellia bacterium]
MKQLFRPFDKNPNALRLRRHPLFQILGLRGIIAQHSEAEERLLQEYAKGRKVLVEIGVAEGASALAARCVADAEAVLYLIDPYVPGRIPRLNLTQICARRYVDRCDNASVRWVQDYSYNAARGWQRPIDFLFIDGDHSYEGCMQDWDEWSNFVPEGGVVAFHDARVFPDGWPQNDWGPVKAVNKLFRGGSSPEWQIVAEVDSLVIIQRNPS